MREKAEKLVRNYLISKDSGLKEEILLSYKSLIHYICRKLAFNPSDYDDLFQIASIALIKALDRFDPQFNTDFSTFVTPNIIGEIKHYFRDKSQVLKVPRKLQETYSRVKAAIREFNQEGVNPSIRELSEKLDLSEEQVLEAMEAAQHATLTSLDAPVSATSDNAFFHEVSQDAQLTHARQKAADPSDDFLTKELLQSCILKLEPRERRIIYLRFYGGLSQQEIGERLNLSQMHISRLLSKAIKNLRKHLPAI